MSQQKIYVIEKSGDFLVPDKAFEAVLAKAKAACSVLVQVNEKEMQKFDIEPTLKELKELQEGFKSEPITFCLHEQRPVQASDLQPHLLVEYNDQIHLAGYLGGPLHPQFDKKPDGTLTPAFFAAKTFLLPLFSKEFNASDHDISQVMNTLMNDAVRKMTITSILGTPESFLYLKAVGNPDPFVFGASVEGMFPEFTWGTMSETCGHMEQAVNVPEPTVAPVRSAASIREKLGLPSEKPKKTYTAPGPTGPSMPIKPPDTPKPNPDGVHTVPQPKKDEPVTKVVNGVTLIEAWPDVTWEKHHKDRWHTFFRVQKPQGFHTKKIPVFVDQDKLTWLNAYLKMLGAGTKLKWADIETAWESYLKSGTMQADTAVEQTMPGKGEPVHLPQTSAPSSTPASEEQLNALRVPVVKAADRVLLKDHFNSKLHKAMVDRHNKAIKDPALYQRAEAQLPKLTDQDVGITWDELISLPLDAFAAFCRSNPDMAAVAMRDMAHVCRNAQGYHGFKEGEYPETETPAPGPAPTPQPKPPVAPPVTKPATTAPAAAKKKVYRVS